MYYKGYTFYTDVQLSHLSDEIQEKVSYFRKRHMEVHEKMAHLALNRIISKKIPRYYRENFSMALFYVNITTAAKLQSKYYPYTLKWCKKEKIKPYSDVSQT